APAPHAPSDGVAPAARRARIRASRSGCRRDRGRAAAVEDVPEPEPLRRQPWPRGSRGGTTACAIRVILSHQDNHARVSGFRRVVTIPSLVRLKPDTTDVFFELLGASA